MAKNWTLSQIKTKRVGAWPLPFFLIVTCIFDVCNFNFRKFQRKKNCFLGCHTNTLGSNLRSSPLEWKINQHLSLSAALPNRKSLMLVNEILWKSSFVQIWFQWNGHILGTIQYYSWMKPHACNPSNQSPELRFGGSHL